MTGNAGQLQTERWKKAVTIVFTALLAILCVLFIKAYMQGRFHSLESLRDYVKGFGIMAPAILTLFQAFQVILPVLPGFFGCAAGALLFGAAGGFWYNYLGISIGSIIAFFLARQYGTSLVKSLFPGESYTKWSDWLGRSRYFTLALFAEPLIGVFAKSDQSAEMQNIGALCIRLQCLVLPIHGWVAVVNMLCAGLGRAGGAVLLATARQGTCFLPIVYPMAYFLGDIGVASVQAVADILTIGLAAPLIRLVRAQIRQAAAA